MSMNQQSKLRRKRKENMFSKCWQVDNAKIYVGSHDDTHYFWSCRYDDPFISGIGRSTGIMDKEEFNQYSSQYLNKHKENQ